MGHDILNKMFKKHYIYIYIYAHVERKQWSKCGKLTVDKNKWRVYIVCTSFVTYL